MATIVEDTVVDQRDPRLAHRSTPVKRAGRRRVRIPACLLTLTEALDVLSTIAPLARAPRHRLRRDVPAARVGIERGPRHAERMGGFGGREIRRRRAHATVYIDLIINIDNANIDS